jgi:SRSO17 transposase
VFSFSVLSGARRDGCEQKRPPIPWLADALEVLADTDAVPGDETGFLKQGKSSCGVARQYTGSVGKITNCQIGVFAAYVSRQGHALIDRALYLPKAWAEDPARRGAADVPETVEFATKPRLARRMIERAIAEAVAFAWVAADTVYGVGEIEMALRRAGRGYVLGVTGTHQAYSWNALPLVGPPPRRSQRRSLPPPGAASRPGVAPIKPDMRLGWLTAGR